MALMVNVAGVGFFLLQSYFAFVTTYQAPCLALSGHVLFLSGQHRLEK